MRWRSSKVEVLSYIVRPSDLAAVMKGVKRCATAVKEALNAGGITVLQLNGTASDQVVPHLHVHIMPRWENDGLPVSSWEMKPGNIGEIEDIAQKIKQRLPSGS
jgi:histidine triad (HIT) family protein